MQPKTQPNIRTMVLALARATKLVPALTKINAFNAAMVAQPVLEQTVEDRDSDVRTARTTLETETHAVDRMNKRFYGRLQAEARTNPALAAALPQIDTETDNLPGTLSIRNVIQGGVSTLHVLVSYVNGTGKNADDKPS